jgi:hypothetical protein
LTQALRQAYSDLFLIKEHPTNQTAKQLKVSLKVITT